MKLYTIYDKVADEGGPLFEAKNHGIAVRSAIQVLQRVPVHLLKDYSLLCVGEISTDHGLLQGQIYNDFEEVPFEKAYFEAFDTEIKEDSKNES